MLKPASYIEYLEVLAVSLLAAHGDGDITVTDPLAPASMAGFSVSPLAAREEIARQRARRSPDGQYRAGDRVKHDLHGAIVLRTPIGESGNWHATKPGSRRKFIVGENHIVERLRKEPRRRAPVR